MADFGDLGAQLKKGLNKGQPATDEKPYDYAESYRLRGKMLGVLIRDARLSASRTIDDCARLLHVDPNVISAWEYGDDVPSLPQLELLAYYLDIPVSHFWSQKTKQGNEPTKTSVQNEYVALRNRMIGGLLRVAREGENLSIQDLESSSFVGELLQMRAEWQKFMDLDEDVRQFAANQTNLGFLKIAMMFSHMPTAELRQVAEGMLEITM